MFGSIVRKLRVEEEGRVVSSSSTNSISIVVDSPQALLQMLPLVFLQCPSSQTVLMVSDNPMIFHDLIIG